MIQRVKQFLQLPQEGDSTDLKNKQWIKSCPSSPTWSGKAKQLGAETGKAGVDSKHLKVQQKGPIRKTSAEHAGELAANNVISPLNSKEIFRMQASWNIVKIKIKEAAVELFLLYGSSTCLKIWCSKCKLSIPWSGCNHSLSFSLIPPGSSFKCRVFQI